jgi:hypothetical protein
MAVVNGSLTSRAKALRNIEDYEKRKYLVCIYARDSWQ